MNDTSSNLSNNLTQGGTAVVLYAYLYNTYMDMLPWLIAALPLLIGDLYFGVKNLLHHHQKVSITKAFAMTIDKGFSYVCWVLISTTLSNAFHVDAIKYLILAFIYLREVISCFRNYMNSKGYDVNEVELFRLLWRKIIKDGESTLSSAEKIITQSKEQEEDQNNEQQK
jgi:hypothetical protein